MHNPEKVFSEGRVSHCPKSHLCPSYCTEDRHCDAKSPEEGALVHNIVSVTICAFSFLDLAWKNLELREADSAENCVDRTYCKEKRGRPPAAKIGQKRSDDQTKQKRCRIDQDKSLQSFYSKCHLSGNWSMSQFRALGARSCQCASSPHGFHMRHLLQRAGRRARISVSL